MFEEIHLLREWIGAVPLEAPLYPLWGWLVCGLMKLGLQAILAAKLVSLFSYLVNASLLFATIYRFAALAVKRAEAAAVFDDADYNGLQWVVSAIGAMTYLLTPGFAAAAFEPTPLLFAQIPPMAALFSISFLTNATRLSTFVWSTFVSGLCIGCAILSGPIGVLPLPLVFAALILPFLRRREVIATSLAITLVGIVVSMGFISMFFARPLSDLLRVIGITAHMIPAGFFYPGAVVFAVCGVLSSFFAVILLSTGRIRPLQLRVIFFTFWGIAALFLGVGTIIWAVRGAERPADRFVAGILEELGGRKVIVSDGLFDDLLAIAIPSDVTVLRLGAEVEVPEALLKSIPDEDVRFAADLGSQAFVTDWLKKDPVAASRVLVVSTRRFETATPGALEPHGWCWVGPSSLHGTVQSPEKLKTLWEERWRTVADGLGGTDISSWTMRRLYAIQGMTIAERLEAVGQARSAEQVRALVISQMDPSYSREAELRRRADREKVMKSAQFLAEMDMMDGAERTARILELEESLLPELERTTSREVSWLIHVLKGELALKKGDEFHSEARDEYRLATFDEFSDLNATAPKLLLLDASLRDDSSLEQDSREVLRRDRANRMALAVLGNILAQQGDNLRAETYLRRATDEKNGPVMIEPLNDLAEVLSRLGRADEALELSDRVIAHRPKAWTFLETRASILMRLGRLDEAEDQLNAAVQYAREAKESDLARNILDIDLARLMKLRRKTGGDYYRLLRNIKSRNLTPAQRRLVDEL